MENALDYTFEPAPELTINEDTTTDVVAYVDSNWAGCKTTRKSISGGVIQLLGTTAHHDSIAQINIATNHAETELDSISHFLLESKMSSKTLLIVNAGSISAKTIANRVGRSKHTKHDQLKYLHAQNMSETGLLNFQNVHKQTPDRHTNQIPSGSGVELPSTTHGNWHKPLRRW